MTAEALVDELKSGSCFPGSPAVVDVIQTHLSVVCLAGDLVFKLKKAITLPFVDFAELEARRRACRDEVLFNRRLCPDTYLGTAALRRIDGVLRFAAIGDDESSDDIDVAVVMKRLPQERMLDELVKVGDVSEAEIIELAELIARFHREAQRGPDVTAHGDPAKLAGFARANFTELDAVPDHALPAALLARLARATADDFDALLPLLRQRADNGFVVDGHGDLHARNVCMTAPPTVYDCIEFEPAFRCGDVATEVAFLAMDLRYRGAASLAATFVGAYVDRSGDAQLPSLLPTLCSYRAMVRAKVAALAAAESEISADDRSGARASARRHLVLASAYAVETRGPWWVVVCGPPASGKSRLCRELAATTHWPHLSTDVVRKELAGIGATEHAAAEHYTREFSERTYAALLEQARQRSATGATVVLIDGNFPSAHHRQRAAKASAEAGSELLIAHVDIDVATAQQRATARQDEAGNISDADAAVTAELHARFEAPTPDEGHALLKLDGRGATAALAEQLIAHMLDGSRSKSSAATAVPASDSA